MSGSTPSAGSAPFSFSHSLGFALPSEVGYLVYMDCRCADVPTTDSQYSFFFNLLFLPSPYVLHRMCVSVGSFCWSCWSCCFRSSLRGLLMDVMSCLFVF
jgi:hypothetical protein